MSGDQKDPWWIKLIVMGLIAGIVVVPVIAIWTEEFWLLTITAVCFLIVYAG